MRPCSGCCWASSAPASCSGSCWAARGARRRLWLGEPRLASAVGIALAAASTVATTIGFVFPWLLASLGRDPAFGSGPLATVIQDVLSLAIYFAMVSWIAL